MAISVVMPALEMAQETGKLLAWRKKEGEAVKKGEPLLEIETDKAVVEIEAPGDGFLAGITAHEGAVIPVGETIAWLVAVGEKAPALKPIAPPSARATSVAPAAERAAAAASKGAAATAATTALPCGRSTSVGVVRIPGGNRSPLAGDARGGGPCRPGDLD